jgi:hypothetical protein
MHVPSMMHVRRVMSKQRCWSIAELTSTSLTIMDGLLCMGHVIRVMGP